MHIYTVYYKSFDVKQKIWVINGPDLKSLFIENFDI